MPRGRPLVCAALLTLVTGCASAPSIPQPHAGQSAIAGTVHDSLLTEGPLPDAIVSIAALGRFTTTDSVGDFAFDSIPPGQHEIVVTHPRLDSVRVYSLQRIVTARSGRIADATVATSSPTSSYLAICGDSLGVDDPRGIVIGTAQRAGTRTPLAGGEIRTRWREWFIGDSLMSVVRTATASIDDVGRFAVCGIPADTEIETQAVYEDSRSGIVLIEGSGRPLRWVDLTLSVREGAVMDEAVVAADPASADTTLSPAMSDTLLAMLRAGTGTATFVGRVIADGRPVDAAQITLAGVGGGTRTDSAGTFRLAGIPAGTHTAVARALGFKPSVATLTLRGGGLDTLDFAMVPSAVTLDAVQVFGRRTPRAQAEAEMMRRASLGRTRVIMGHRLANQFSIVDAMRGEGFIRVNASGPDRWVTMRSFGGDCFPTILIDGREAPPSINQPPDGIPLELLVHPSEVLAIEYARNEVPAALLGASRDKKCGSIAIWRK